VSDWSQAGVQPDGSEGHVRPLQRALGEQFPRLFPRRQQNGAIDALEKNVTDKDLDNPSIVANCGKGLISFHRIFPTGHAMVSLGMKRRKYFEKLEEMSEIIAEVIDHFSSCNSSTQPNEKHALPNFETVSLNMLPTDSSDDETSAFRNLTNGSEVNGRNSAKNGRKKSEHGNVFVVMSEDLLLDLCDGKDAEQTVPKFLLQIDFLRAILLKPQSIEQYYSNLKCKNNHISTSRCSAKTADIYLVDVGIVTRTKISSLMSIKNEDILHAAPLLRFAKIKSLDRSFDLDIASACARAICHIMDDQDAQRPMMKHIVVNDFSASLRYQLFVLA